jgi:Fe-S cluster biogenesis protein NfuA
MDKEKEVNEVLDELRPFLMNDGGNIELIKIENGTVYVRFQGACALCAMQDMTFQDGIEKLILEKVEGIKKVELIV